MIQGLVRAAERTLGQVAGAAAYPFTTGGGLVVAGVTDDSRDCQPGDIFVAVPGTACDGLEFAADAVARGAVAVAAERDPKLGVPWLRVPSARVAAGRLADIIYRDPSAQIVLIAVTGTNGKTTTAHLIAQLLPGQVGFIGTTGVIYPGVTAVARNTTPGAIAMRRHLRAMVDAGCVACVAEVSSHALDQHRVDGLRFDAAVYTNLSGDHLDYHGSMEAYAAAKARLFTELLDPKATAVLNARDPACNRIHTTAHVVRFLPEEIEVGAAGTHFRWHGRKVFMPLVGHHNAENAVAALETVCALGMPPAEAVAALGGVLPARGRLEPVQRDPFLVVVDYAHTDDALEQALRAVREVTAGQLLLVFGCGGDRDRTKRPRMGAVAAQWADRIFITNDNPRSEDPGRIASEVEAGVGRQRAAVVLDRRTAIRQAIAAARPGDTVLIAGKGHETYQQVGSRRLPFDDASVAREVLAL